MNPKPEEQQSKRVIPSYYRLLHTKHIKKMPIPYVCINVAYEALIWNFCLDVLAFQLYTSMQWPGEDQQVCRKTLSQRQF